MDGFWPERSRLSGQTDALRRVTSKLWVPLRYVLARERSWCTPLDLQYLQHLQCSEPSSFAPCSDIME